MPLWMWMLAQAPGWWPANQTTSSPPDLGAAEAELSLALDGRAEVGELALRWLWRPDGVGRLGALELERGDTMVVARPPVTEGPVYWELQALGHLLSIDGDRALRVRVDVLEAPLARLTSEAIVAAGREVCSDPGMPGSVASEGAWILSWVDERGEPTCAVTVGLWSGRTRSWDSPARSQAD